MIEDQPGWQAYHLLLEALYQYHRCEILWLVPWNPSLRLPQRPYIQCHEAFYTPPTWSFVWQGM